MIRQFPLIATPTPYPLFVVDGGDLALVAVQVERSEVVVHLRIVLDDAGAEEKEEHVRAVEDWATAGRDGHPPLDPAERRLRGVSISLTDDGGGTYRWHRSRIGGSGHSFSAEYYFEGNLPEAATSLIVEATTEAGEHGSAHLLL